MATADSSLTAVHEAIEKTLTGFLKGYEISTTNKDASYVLTGLAPDCKRYFSPTCFLTTMGLPDNHTLDNSMYKEKYSKMLPVYSTKKTEIFNVTIDPWKKKGAARTYSHCEYSDGVTMVWELAWFLDFTEDGTRITEIRQFVDSMVQPTVNAKCTSLLEAGEQTMK